MNKNLLLWYGRGTEARIIILISQMEECHSRLLLWKQIFVERENEKMRLLTENVSMLT